MRLELDGRGGVCLVEGLSNVERLACQLEMVLDNNPVEKDRDIGRRFERAVGVECRRGPGNIVGLPFSGFPIRVRERNALFVDAAGLAVYIGLVVVVIEDLQLISVVSGPS